MVRVMSVVPSSYWPPEIDKKQFARGDAPVAVARDAVMHNGAVRAGAGDGRERDVLEQAGVAAETFQSLDRFDFAQLAVWCYAIEPGEEACHRDAVAQLRGAGARDLGGVLDRLHRRNRIAAAHYLAAGLDHEPRDRLRTGGRIEPYRAMRFAECSKIALKIFGGADCGQFFEAMPDVVAELAAVDVERRAALLRHQRKGERHRRVRHIAAADVEQPANGLWIGHHQRVGLEFLYVCSHPCEFRSSVLAGIAQLVQRHRAERRRRPILPTRIDRIVGDGNEAAARCLAGFAETLGAVDGVQPRRITELGFGRQILLDPCHRRMLDQMFDRESGRVHFIARLHRIAAVDEKDGTVGEHDGDAR